MAEDRSHRSHRPRRSRRSLAAAIAESLAARGTRLAFGVPGGGGGLEIIDALTARDIRFVLAAGETAAALMAATVAELTGAPGVVLTGVGPGAASVVNGVAFAALERAPLLVLTDRQTDGPGLHAAHQRFDQQAMLAPLVRAGARPEPGRGAARVAGLLDLAWRHPRGPVHLDISAAEARADAGGLPPAAPPEAPPAPRPRALARARALLAGARRPAMIAGRGVREAGWAGLVRRLAARWGMPVLTSYAGRGALPDDHPLAVGCYTGAAGEARLLAGVDLVVAVGLDPAEPIPHRPDPGRTWLALAPWPTEGLPVAPAVALTGEPGVLGLALADGDTGGTEGWPGLEVRALADGLRGLVLSGDGPRSAVDIVRATARAAAAHGGDWRACVDSGAHMFAAMALWPVAGPLDILKSNGLSTMGYALPAAIGAALADPARPLVVFTGDGGLAMCAAELATAAREGCRIAVVVLNDAALSLIAVKQTARGLAGGGVTTGPVDFARVAEGFGCRGLDAGEDTDFAQVIADGLGLARAGGPPVVIDVATDPSGYVAQIAALRGDG